MGTEPADRDAEAGPPTRGAEWGAAGSPRRLFTRPLPSPAQSLLTRSPGLARGGTGWEETAPEAPEGLSARPGVGARAALASPAAWCVRCPGLWGGSSLHPRPLRPEAGQEAELAGDRR